MDTNCHNEPICDWSDLPTTMCAHCTHNPHQPDPAGWHTPNQPARPGQPINLDQYRGLPYYQPAATHPRPSHGQPCPCGQPTGDAYLCPTCTDQLDVVLGNVPALLEDLEIFQQGHATNRTPAFQQGVRDPESLLYATKWANLDEAARTDLIARQIAILGRGRPDRAQATRLLADLHNRLMNAVRLLSGAAPTVDTHDCTSVGLSRWLLSHRPHLHPAAPQILNDLGRIHDQVIRLIDNAPEHIWYGHCPCDTEISVPRGAQLWTCPTCATTWTVSDLEDQKLQRARDALLTIDELALLARHKSDTVKHFLARRGIPARGTWAGQQLYRAGDYLDARNRGA